MKIMTVEAQICLVKTRRRFYKQRRVEEENEVESDIF